jgi:lipoprotein-anchoring transpeptidase ErfK/SrfK
MQWRQVRTSVIIGLVAATIFVPGGATAAAPAIPATYPAAGELMANRVVARAEPDPAARIVRVFHQFRRDYRFQVFFALGQATGTDGATWFKVSVPMRPNGRVGWVRAGTVALKPTPSRIVVHRGRRIIEVFRGERLVMRAKVAVGSPGRETPLGNFYVTARFVPGDSFLGVFALETSAYSRLTEWPGGGIVGIHGTSMPWLLGKAVSHGCVRVANATALKLRRFAPVGTPISIVAD